MKILNLSLRAFVPLLLLMLPLSGLSQQANTGNWLMYFGMNKLSNTFSIHTEVQYRNHTIAPTNAEQLLLRTGLNYHFAKNAFVTAGYGYITGYQYQSPQSQPESKEHRIWQQFILTSKINRVKFEHRYRIEQRWVNQDYRNRFRYRLMLFIPVNKPKIEKGTVFIGLYDEVFINGSRDFFDRNRFYGAIGYQIHKTSGVQVGMMQQQLNDFGKWYLQFALVFNPDFTSKESK